MEPAEREREKRTMLQQITRRTSELVLHDPWECSVPVVTQQEPPQLFAMTLLSSHLLALQSGHAGWEGHSSWLA